MKTTTAALLALALALLQSCANGASYVARHPDGTTEIVTTYTGAFDKSASEDSAVTLANGTRLEYHSRARDNTKAASLWSQLQSVKQLSPITEKLKAN